MERTKEQILAGVYVAIRNKVQDALNIGGKAFFREIGPSARRVTKRLLKTAILEHTVATVLTMKCDHSSLSNILQPMHWFRLMVNVNDSKSARVLNLCRAGDYGLRKPKTKQSWSTVQDTSIM